MKATDQQILEKAIAKAIEGGWNPTHFDTLKGNYKHPEDSEFHDLLGDWHNISPLDVIFNHDFAKALWGEESERVWMCPACDYSFDYTWHGETQNHCPYDGRKLKEVARVKGWGNHPWQYHLQQMVVAEDPIGYLGENI